MSASIRVLLALLTFAIPLTQVPAALAVASGPNVAAVFPVYNFSNRDVQLFNVIFDSPVTDATQNMILLDGTAANCTRVPFARSGIVVEVQVAGCSDGDIRIGVAANTVHDENGVLGPNAISWSEPTHISHAIPVFAIGNLRATTPGEFKFDFLTPTGVLTQNPLAFEFNQPGCVAALDFFTSSDISYTATGCPTGVPITVAFEPYSFFDWYANAGPASRVASLPIVLSAAELPPLPAPAPSPSFTAVASPNPTPAVSSSPAPSLTPGTATLAEMLGMGAGPVAPDVVATSTPVAEMPVPVIEEPSPTSVFEMPSNQDEPVGRPVGYQVLSDDLSDGLSDPRSDAAAPPTKTYLPVDLGVDENNSAAQVIGEAIILAGAVALAVACVIYLRGRKPRIGFRVRSA